MIPIPWVYACAYALLVALLPPEAAMAGALHRAVAALRAVARVPSSVASLAVYERTKAFLAIAVRHVNHLLQGDRWDVRNSQGGGGLSNKSKRGRHRSRTSTWGTVGSCTKLDSA